MGIWRKLKFRRTAEAEMQEEFRSLREIAGGRELGNLTYAAEEARDRILGRQRCDVRR